MERDDMSRQVPSCLIFGIDGQTLVGSLRRHDDLVRRQVGADILPQSPTVFIYSQYFTVAEQQPEGLFYKGQIGGRIQIPRAFVSAGEDVIAVGAVQSLRRNHHTPG